jgi:hypothetical protein
MCVNRNQNQGFLAWVSAQRAEACEVHSCHEAGAFGCVLHRKLVALGIKNVVVCSRVWDGYHKKVKTSWRDALALCGMPDRPTGIRRATPGRCA